MSLLYLSSFFLADEVQRGVADGRGVLVSTACAVVYWYLVRGLSAVLSARFFHRAWGSPENHDKIRIWVRQHAQVGLPGLAYVSVVLVLVAPLVEEMLYRGLLFHVLDGAPVPVVVLVSAVTFAMAHAGGRSAPLQHWCGGMLFGVLRVRYGLLAATVAHAVFNGCVTWSWFSTAWDRWVERSREGEQPGPAGS